MVASVTMSQTAQPTTQPPPAAPGAAGQVQFTLAQLQAARKDPAGLAAAVRARREQVTALNAERETHERELAAARAEYSKWAEHIAQLKETVTKRGQDRANLLRELDVLLQLKARIDNERLVASGANAAAIGAPQPAQKGTPPARLHAPPPSAAAPAAPTPVTAAPPAATPVIQSPGFFAGAATTTPVAVPTPSTAQPTPAAPTRIAAVPAEAAVAPVAQQPARASNVTPMAPPQLPRATPPEAKTGAERRLQPRVPLAVEVDLGSESNLYVGFSENISEGGIFVATYEPRKMGERMPVTFNLPGAKEPIRCEVEVAWILEYGEGADPGSDKVPGMGLRFVSLADSDRELVNDFIRQREPLFFPG